MNPAAFDALATDYDAVFSHSALGRMLRQRVWRVLGDYFQAGQHLLDLACGTGEDAVWLAQQGIAVTAVDGSAKMVEKTAAKAQQASLSRLITPIHLSLQAFADTPVVHNLLPKAPYDGALSNFGGLNTLAALRPLAAALAQLVRPGGFLVLVPMGPICPWEIGWHGWHGQWQTAVRRLRQPATARIGHELIPVWYPSPRRLRQAFAPWFTPGHLESLGLWLPPSYLAGYVERWPRIFAGLSRLERKMGQLSAGWGDHFIMVLRRRPGAGQG
jgi:SAM-dependent methyltransferase